MADLTAAIAVRFGVVQHGRTCAVMTRMRTSRSAVFDRKPHIEVGKARSGAYGMPDGTPFTLGTRTEPKATAAGIKPGHHPTAHCTDRRQRMEWQPIETAPLDGTAFIVADETGARVVSFQPSIGAFSPGGGNIFNWSENPTHWMPLPAPPDRPTAKEE